MEAQIQKKNPDFKPAGLQEYIDSHDEAGTEEARTKVLQIQKRIFDYVIGVLKKEYGTQDKAWWVEGVPPKIRMDCSSRWEEKIVRATKKVNCTCRTTLKYAFKIGTWSKT